MKFGEFEQYRRERAADDERPAWDWAVDGGAGFTIHIDGRQFGIEYVRHDRWRARMLTDGEDEAQSLGGEYLSSYYAMNACALTIRVGNADHRWSVYGPSKPRTERPAIRANRARKMRTASPAVDKALVASRPPRQALGEPHDPPHAPGLGRCLPCDREWEQQEDVRREAIPCVATAHRPSCTRAAVAHAIGAGTQETAQTLDACPVWRAERRSL